MLMSTANTWSRLKRLIFYSTYWSSIVEKVFKLMADEEWGEHDKKKDWVEEVGEKNMVAVLIV